MTTNCLDPLAALREGVATLHEEAGGAVAVFVIPREETQRLAAAALLGDPLAEALTDLVEQFTRFANGSPSYNPTQCACCPRSIRKKRFVPVVVLPRVEEPSKGLTLGLCERCTQGKSREAVRSLVNEALRQVWPDSRPIGPVTHPEGGRA